MQGEPRRVLRVLEYIGEEGWIEHTLDNSIHGHLIVRDDEGEVVGMIRAAIVGIYPEYVEQAYFDQLVNRGVNNGGLSGKPELKGIEKDNGPNEIG